MAEREAEFAFQLAEVATEPGDAAHERVLSLLCAVGDAPAAILTGWAGPGVRSTVMASRGYSREAIDHITAADFHELDPAYQQIMADSRRPLRCWWDLDFDYAESQIARDVLLPLGFGGGMSMRLQTRDGRYVGDLHMSTEERRFPTPAAMRLLCRSRVIVAGLYQRAGTVSPELSTLPDADHVFLIRTEGSVEVLLTTTALNPPEVDITALMRLLCPNEASRPRRDRAMRWLGADGIWRSVSLSPVRAGTIVALRAEPLPHRLTLRDLEVLSLLAEGMSNFSIGRRLVLSERTIAHRIERLFDKLGVTARAEAAATAEREGLVLLR